MHPGADGMAVIRHRKTPPPAPPRRRSRLRRALPAIIVLVLVILGVFVVRPFWQLTSQFDDLTFRQPSRVYALASRATVGRHYPSDLLIKDLRAEGYREDEREDDSDEPLPAGRYRRSRRGLAVHLRSFPRPDGSRGGGLAEITYRGSRIAALRQDGKKVESVVIEPPLLASYYGSDLHERRPVELADISKDLIRAVIAAEDDNFYDHSGISVTGIARAVWVNYRGGSIRQGGSTLTQQLVKNIYLTHERTWDRKAQELILAVLLELRYSKQEILEAYLNEIYLGGSGGVSLLGMGAASRAYFGKDPGQVGLAEAATLAGIIRAPASYSPLAHPEKAKQRRDWVLGRMEKLRLAEPERVARALASPLSVAPEPLVRRRAPYFADAIAAEAQRRFGIEDLADGGYLLFSTLDWRNQQAALESVEWGLEQAEKGYQKSQKGKNVLQAALVSVDPESGGIRAYIGGRSYGQSQFDRAGQARRQAGSTFKPIVYAAAFESGKVSPASFLEDTPLTVRLATMSWSPRNDDGSFHGWVSVRSALEKSYNPATARLALQVGMPKIVDLAHGMGITDDMDPFPSVALGAVEATPVEMAGAYATLANGGVRPPVHGLLAVVDRYGKPMEGAGLPPPRRVISPQSAFMVTSLLQGVFERGTARGAARGFKGDVAGKTGTTNKRRDSWFAGYSPDRTTVVWVGYDDNASTRLSGARAALPIWVRFTDRVAPGTGFGTFEQPPGVTSALIDPGTGKLATGYCPYTLTEVFRDGQAPTELCDRHQSYYETEIAEALDARDAEEAGEIGAGGDEGEERATARPAERKEPRTIRRWFKKVFGGKDEKKPEEKDDDGG